MRTAYDIIHTNGRRETVEIELEAEPGYERLNEIVAPVIGVDDHCFERVAVLHNDERRDMFVDEVGQLKGLARNEVATEIYRSAMMSAYPNADPECMPSIVGTAVLFHRRVWF